MDDSNAPPADKPSNCCNTQEPIESSRSTISHFNKVVFSLKPFLVATNLYIDAKTQANPTLDENRTAQ